MSDFRIDTTELMEANKRIAKLGKHLVVTTRELTKASKPYITAVRQAAPKAEKDVHRYSTPKLMGKLKAPKGQGVKVATYTPGNAARSFRRLSLRRVKRSIYIGPIRKRGVGSRGIFSGARADGYYVPILEQRRPFIHQAWSASKGQVIRNLAELYKSKANATL